MLIKLTHTTGNEEMREVWLNPDCIVTAQRCPRRNETHVLIRLGSGTLSLFVEETPEFIQGAIIGASHEIRGIGGVR